MKISRLYALFYFMLIADPVKAQELPQHLKCIQAGSWGCSTDGICIDGPYGRGRKYQFDWAKMTFRSPEGGGHIVAGDSLNTFQLSDGTTAAYRGKPIITGESIVDIKISPSTIYSLWCLEGRWPLKPFSPEWLRSRERITD